MPPTTADADDPHSFARPGEVVVRHIDLDLLIDFGRRELQGTATLTLDWQRAAAGELVLDAEGLAIAAIEAVDTGGQVQTLNYVMADQVTAMGSKLSIAAPDQPHRIRISYRTAPEASGLQWLEPAQTADHQSPFLFSQSEATHARSWLPCQDSPAIRCTWRARVAAPAGIRVVMSAPNDPRQPAGGVFEFSQPHPVPSYLLAIAAGDLAVRATGPRTAVYAEPSVVGQAAHEFEDTEQMIAAAESLYGPYRWGRYDILVLPSSFPYGGMENPNMTFATPTVLVGDKSLVSLVAHELAHSWSGNLVTAATWRDIWLNEGVTTYVQGRITEALYGERQATAETLLAIRRLQASIGDKPENRQRLAPEPRAGSADDELSDVAYDKGSWFMRTLESKFGRKVFDAWLDGYFKHFAWHSISTEQMLAWLRANLIEMHPGRMRWEEVEQWVYGSGIPEGAPVPDAPHFDAIDAARSAFLDGQLAASELGAANWNTQEWMYFLDHLPAPPPLAKMRELDTAWRLTGTHNAEIGMRWYVHAIAAGGREVWPAAATHMTRIGRMYLTMPLYKALVKTADGFAFAEQVFAKARDGYHPLTRMAVEKLFAKIHAAADASGAGNG